MPLNEIALWLGVVSMAAVLYFSSTRTHGDRIRDVLRVLAYMLAVVGVKELSYASYFGPVGENPGVFWLSSGLHVAVLLCVSWRRYPLYVLLTALAHLASGNLLHDLPWQANLWWTFATITEGIVGSVLLRSVVSGKPDITQPSTFLLFFVLCGGVATAVCAAIGSAVLALVYDQTQWFVNWQVWWLSDAMGVLSLGATILAWSSHTERLPTNRGKRRLLEGTSLCLLLVLVATAVLGPFSIVTESVLDYPYLVIPLLFWVALRFDVRLATAAALYVSIVTVYTANGILAQLPGIPESALGPFMQSGNSIAGTVIALQAFLFVSLLTTQVLVTLNYQRQRAEAERLSIQDQLYESQRMESVAQLAGGVAHDLNNLLAVITLYRDQVEERVGDDASLKPALEAMDDAAGSATAMSRSLLDLSRQAEISTGPVNVRNLLQRTMQVCKPLLPPNIRVNLVIDVSRDLEIVGDANHLQQAILNLVLNARDAMTPGGGELTVWARPCDDAEHSILIDVQDTGVGISAEQLEHVFEPLFTTKAHGKGTGLGLSIVQSIIDGHGGSIEVQTAPGEGTTVRLLLPFNPADTREIKQADHLASLLDGQGQADRSTHPLTVLVCIGHPQIRGAVLAELRGQGCHAESCDSVEELFELANRVGERVRAVVDLRSLPNRESIISGPLPVPTIVLTDQSPPPNLADPSSQIMTLPFKVQKLVDTVKGLR